MLDYLKKISPYFIINFIFLSICLIVSVLDIKIFIIPVILIYVMYNIFSTEMSIVTNQIVLAILYSSSYTFLWAAREYAVPMEVKYVIYILNIIIILKIFIKYDIYMKCLRDWIVLLSLLFILLSGILFLFSNVSFLNYIMSLEIYLRFLPAYIVLSVNNKYNKSDLYLFCVLNAVMIFAEYIQYSRGKFGPDNISGIFGISNVQALLLFMVIIYGILLTCYIYKKINLMLFSMSLIVLFLIAGVGEIKIFFLAVPFVTILILFLNMKNFFRFFKIVAPIIIFTVIGIRILISVSPFFSGFFNVDTIQENIYNYTMVTNNKRFVLGRFENIVYTNEDILTSAYKKVLGLGVGSSMPDENWYYKTHDNGNRTILDLYETDLYKSYGPSLGYHFSSMNIIYLEMGFVGLLIFYLGISLQFFRSWVIFKKSEVLKDKCLAIASISLLLVLVPLMFYYPYLLDIDASLIFIIVMALVTNKYNYYN